MARSERIRRVASSGFAGLAISILLCGADDTKQKVDAKGLTFDAPASWKSSPPSSRMRRAQLKVEPMAGDDYPAEMVVFAFQGGAGSLEANLDRWKKQFTDKDGKPPKMENTKVKGKNIEVTRVETSGHYHPSQFPGLAPEPDRSDARLLLGFVVTDNASYVLKMVGPNKTMIKIRPEFDELLKTISVEDK